MQYFLMLELISHLLLQFHQLQEEISSTILIMINSNMEKKFTTIYLEFLLVPKAQRL